MLYYHHVNLVLSAAAGYLGGALSCRARFCCCYRSLAAVLVLSAPAVVVHSLLFWCSIISVLAAATGVIIWKFWFVLCCVDVPIAEAHH
ncbi:hypothetical protein MAM1_0319d09625 [Mucor ambiguus]|uniref:Uncharacterized protein n=1 Tax=Mucor ambiguus TaxID=91626 RepID=A0A0C9MRL3_9FUNG|nr:hypothetical protein MAM1_0319d09625 [Mucor ambiguus]